jgi:hypothetical protein
MEAPGAEIMQDPMRWRMEITRSRIGGMSQSGMELVMQRLAGARYRRQQSASAENRG